MAASRCFYIEMFFGQKENPNDLSFGFLVGADGFEPSKHYAADLQSVPIGHSGKLPSLFSCAVLFALTCQVLIYYSKGFREMQVFFQKKFVDKSLLAKKI